MLCQQGAMAAEAAVPAADTRPSQQPGLGARLPRGPSRAGKMGSSSQQWIEDLGADEERQIEDQFFRGIDDNKDGELDEAELRDYIEDELHHSGGTTFDEATEVRGSGQTGVWTGN